MMLLISRKQKGSQPHKAKQTEHVGKKLLTPFDTVTMISLGFDFGTAGDPDRKPTDKTPRLISFFLV